MVTICCLTYTLRGTKEAFRHVTFAETSRVERSKIGRAVAVIVVTGTAIVSTVTIVFVVISAILWVDCSDIC